MTAQPLPANDAGPANRRLNPFALPSETNVRFSLYVVTAVMLGLQFIVSIEAALGADWLLDPTHSPTSDALPFTGAVWGTLLFLAILAGVLAVVFGLAFLLYRRHPLRIQRKGMLQPYPNDKNPWFTAEVSDLSSRAGVVPAPVIEVGPGSVTTDGQVFGFPGRYHLRLGSQMPLMLRKKPALFKATVQHELAHIANGDVSRAYFTQSLWTAVLALLAVPYLLCYILIFAQRILNDFIHLVSGQGIDFLRLLMVALPTFIWTLLQVAVLLALFAVVRAGLLRSREVYADWKANLWGAGPGLEAIFRQDASAKKASALARLLRLHPTPADRLLKLEQPRQLFGIPWDLPLVVGTLTASAMSGTFMVSIFIATSLAAGGMAAFQGPGTGGSWLGFFLLILTILAVMVFTVLLLIGPQAGLAWLAGGSLGLQVARDGLASLAEHEPRGLRPYLRLLPVAGLFAVGIQLGFLLTPTSFLAPIPSLIGYQGSLLALLGIPFETVAWTLALTFLCWLWLCYARFLSRRLLGRHVGTRPPKGKRLFLIGLLALLLWLVFVPALGVQPLIYGVLNANGSPIPASVILPVTFIGMGLAGMVAVLGLGVAWLFRGRITCPSCGRPSTHSSAVGQACEHCGRELAPWLYVPDPAAPGQFDTP